MKPTNNLRWRYITKHNYVSSTFDTQVRVLQQKWVSINPFSNKSEWRDIN